MVTKTYHIHQGGMLLEGLGNNFPQPKSPADYGPGTALIRVIHDLPKGVKLRHQKLYGGVEGRIVSRLRGNTLMLVKRGDPTTIFAHDGSVQVIEFVDDEPRMRMLVPQDALKVRLDSIEIDLLNIRDPELEFTDKQRCQIEDKLLHEVAEMLGKVGGLAFMYRQILVFAERTMSKMEVRGGVRKHFEEVLKSLGDTTVYGWLYGKPESSAEIIPLFPTEQKRSGPPASAETKKNARRQRDQETREKMRGGTGGGKTSESPSSGKKQSGKK